MKTAIISDSAFGDPKNTDKNFFILPLNIFTTNENNNIDNNLSIEEYIKLTDKYEFKSSQSNPSQVEKLWDEVLKNYNNIIYCGIAKSLSSQYEMIKNVSNQKKYKDKVFVINSNGVSVILHHQIETIKSLLSQNIPLKEIKKIIEHENTNYEAYIIPKNWTTIKKSGRVSKLVAFIAQSLGLAIVIKAKNGKLIFDSKQRTFLKAIKYSLNELINKIPNLKEIDIAYGNINEDVIFKIKNLIKEYNLKINLWEQISIPIMIHIGTESIAFVGWKK